MFLNSKYESLFASRTIRSRAYAGTSGRSEGVFATARKPRWAPRPTHRRRSEQPPCSAPTGMRFSVHAG
jgi:hypothetical protein